jgi:hypothetical protein
VEGRQDDEARDGAEEGIDDQVIGKDRYAKGMFLFLLLALPREIRVSMAGSVPVEHQ